MLKSTEQDSILCAAEVALSRGVSHKQVLEALAKLEPEPCRCTKCDGLGAIGDAWWDSTWNTWRVDLCKACEGTGEAGRGVSEPCPDTLPAASMEASV